MLDGRRTSVRRPLAIRSLSPLPILVVAAKVIA
jgi:hypothetical protein